MHSDNTRSASKIHIQLKERTTEKFPSDITEQLFGTVYQWKSEIGILSTSLNSSYKIICLRSTLYNNGQ